jgi:hypothetical protein
MLGIKDFSKQIDVIVKEITDNYTIDSAMVKLGYNILNKRNNKNCLTLSDNFYYFSDAVKQLYNDINTYFTTIETYENELCMIASKICDNAQTEICDCLKQYYNVGEYNV